MSKVSLVRGLAVLSITLAACHDYRVLTAPDGGDAGAPTDGGDADAPTDVDGADAPTGVDGADAPEAAVCPAGKKICGDQCVPETMTCALSCSAGTHMCGGACKSDTDVGFCGATCERCPVPQNGSAVCDGACSAKCDATFNLCGTSCKASTDPTACGPGCIRCEAPTGGSATCDGTKCGAPTCPTGQKVCNNACIDAARSCNGICSNGKYSCPDGVCRDTNVVTSCGTACQPCAAKPNAAATSCSATGTCGYTCNTGFLQCGDGSCGRSKWDFETGDVQGVSGGGQNPGSVEMVSVRTDRAHTGTHALAGRLLQGEDFYFLVIDAPICASQGLDVTGKKISAWVYLEAPDAFPYVCINFSSGNALCPGAKPSQWSYVEAVGSGILYRFSLEVSGGGPWTGRVYVDDLQIAP